MSQITTNVPIDRGARTDERQRAAFQVLADPATGNVGGTAPGNGLSVDPNDGTLNVNAGAGIAIGPDPLTGFPNRVHISLPQNGQAPSLVAETQPLEFNGLGHLKLKIQNAALTNADGGRPEQVAGTGLVMDRRGVGVQTNFFRSIELAAPGVGGGIGLRMAADIGLPSGLQRSGLGYPFLDAKTAALQQGLPWSRVVDITGAQVRTGSAGITDVPIFVETEFTSMPHLVWAVLLYHYGPTAMHPTDNVGTTLSVSVGVTSNRTRFTPNIPFWLRNGGAVPPNDAIPTGSYDVRMPYLLGAGTATDYVSPGRRAQFGAGETFTVRFQSSTAAGVQTVPIASKVRVQIIGYPVSTVAGPQPLNAAIGNGSWPTP